MDYHTDVIPPGIYLLNIQGVDMQNLNALLLPAKALCVSQTGIVCTPLHPYLLGDTVFVDTNENGVQDPGEPGIGNVEIELVDASGYVLSTTHTDADGNTYQDRTLADGSRHRVRKNFPTAAQLRTAVAPYAAQIEVLELSYYWLMTFTTKDGVARST